MRNRTVFVFALVVLAFSLAASHGRAATPSDAKSQPTNSAGNPNLLVSTQWLADHLSDPHLVIVHIGHDHGEYLAAHVPGARFLAMDKFTTNSDPGAELLPPDQLKQNLEAIGIGDDSRVVYYAPDWDPMATRLFFTLDYLGHGDQAALLDGGMDRWLTEKRSTSTEEPKITPGKLTVHLHPEIVAKMDWMTKLVAEKPAPSGVILIDARPAKRYRAGHLPGAESMYWQTAIISEDNPVLRSPQELKQKFDEAGVTKDKKIVSYCEVGLQASYTYFLARYLGYEAAMYDGSYNEWSGSKQPVVRGNSPQ